MNISTTKSTYRAGSQFADVDDSHIAAEVGLPRITATSYTGALSINDGGAGGNFTLISPGVWDYTPANRTQSVTISVTDDLETDTLVIAVTATWPFQPNAGYEFDTPTNSRVLVAKDNTPKFRRMPKRGAVWNYFFLNRIIADVSVAKSFELFHDIDKEFYIIDPELVLQIKARLDSSVKVKVNGANNFEMSVIAKVYKVDTLNIPTSYV